ncbi:MAG: O-antigen ligase family protein [Clostridia bacterium]|nr:O-antigen ligase family protein [Clostridia bacterium]
MKQKKPKLQSFSSLVSHSLILPFLYRISVFLYQSVRESAVGRYFCGYDKANASMEHSLCSALGNKLSLTDRFLRPLRFHVSAQFDNSFFMHLIRALLDRLAGMSLGTYGLAVLFFSLFSGISYALRLIAGNEPAISNPIITGAFLLIGICLVASNIHLSDALCKSVFLSFLLFRVAGANEEYFRAVPKTHGKPLIAVSIGSILGLAVLAVDVIWVLAAVVAVIGALMIYKIPEFGVVAVLFLAPFLPTMVLIACMMFLLVSFFVKFLRGKRVIHIELLDLSILLFGVVFFCAGVFSASPQDSLFPALVFICFMCGYFLVVNLIRSSEWLIRCYYAVLSAAIIVALYGIYQNFFGGAATTWLDTTMFKDISGRVVSTFENPNVLAEYLIMILPISIAGFLTAKSASQRLLFLFMAGILGGCLVFTWSRGAWLGFLIAMMLFLLMYSKKFLVIGLLGIPAIPLLPFILPASITNRFLSIGNLGDTSTSYRVHIWEGTFNMLEDHFLGGIGIGVNVFQKVYPRYALSAIEAAPHSHNLYLQILVETGILGLFLFMVFLLIFVRYNFTFFTKYLPQKTRLFCAALFCGILAVLAQGMTDYIWYNYRVYLIFWLLIGLTVATARTAQAENRDAIPQNEQTAMHQAELDLTPSLLSKAPSGSGAHSTASHGKEQK